MELKTGSTNEQLRAAWGNSNFGDTSKRNVLRVALLQYACKYSTGRTIECICKELGLITSQRSLTKTGNEYLFGAYENGTLV